MKSIVLFNNLCVSNNRLKLTLLKDTIVSYGITLEFLQKEYVENSKSVEELSKIIGCSKHTIYLYINRFNLNKNKNEKLLDTIMSKKFGKLTPIKLGQKRKEKTTIDCICDCGHTKNVTLGALVGGYVKSCGCLKPKLNGKFTNSLFSKIKDRANKKNINFDITFDYLVNLYEKQKGICALSGLSITFMSSYQNYESNTASLDRIDSTIGYIEGNVQWVHKHINSMKWALSQEYFIKLCKTIAEYN